MLRPLAALVASLLLAGCFVPVTTERGNATDPSPVVSGETSPPATTSPATTTPGTSPPPSATPATRPPTGNPDGMRPPHEERPSERFPGCTGSGPVRFTVSPMREEDFTHLLPYGLVVGAHVTPIDHMYFAPPHGSVRDQYEVRAIADGVIWNLQPRDVHVDTGQARAREWRMDVAHTCTFTSYFDLLTSLDPAIEKAMNESREARRPGIPIQAGQVVGRIGAQTLDFGVYDYNVTLPGFLVPEHYDAESWKVHTVDPFPHFDEPVRAMLLSKAMRAVEPRAGKIDHDVDGTAAGNWFANGTNGYQGLEQSKYWDGHLALVPDYLDPSQVRFSIGNFGGTARQFGVKGNAPAPVNVTPESGLVEYELTTYEHYDRADPARTGFGPGGLRPGSDVAARNHEQVQGVALVQMLGPRMLKVEVFPGKTAAQVDGFTDAARIYAR